eukprot:SAG31_NODE_12420_length_943_cov_1.319905_2_plen_71_part_00
MVYVCGHHAAGARKHALSSGVHVVTLKSMPPMASSKRIDSPRPGMAKYVTSIGGDAWLWRARFFEVFLPG